MTIPRPGFDGPEGAKGAASVAEAPVPQPNSRRFLQCQMTKKQRSMSITTR